jgi:hypothetical protein
MSCLVSRSDGGSWVWDVTFAHNFNDWEVEVVVAFLNLLDSHVLFWKGADGWQWRMKQDGVFDALQGSHVMTFPWRSIWSVKPP